MQHRISIDIFPVADDTVNAAKSLGEQRAFVRCRVALREGGLARAVSYYADHPSPELIIVEDDSDSATMQSRLDTLAQVVESGRKLIVIGSANDISIYRRVVSLGVTDYLVSPVPLDAMMDAIERALHDPRGPQLSRYIAVIGARGGVGSSAIAHNLAWACAHKAGVRTILADLDLVYGTAALAFNQDPKQPFADAFMDPERLDPTLLERYMSGEEEYLQILSTNGSLRHYESINEETVDKVVDLCRQMAKLVILDIPHVWTEWVEGLLVGADETVVVVAPDLANIRDARNLVDFLHGKRGESKAPRLIINKADLAKKTRLLPKDISNTLGLEPIATIPFDPATFIEAANEGKMIGERFKTHKMVGVFSDLAMRLGVRSGGAAPRRGGIASLFAGRQKRTA